MREADYISEPTRRMWSSSLRFHWCRERIRCHVHTISQPNITLRF